MPWISKKIIGIALNAAITLYKILGSASVQSFMNIRRSAKTLFIFNCSPTANEWINRVVIFRHDECSRTMCNTTLKIVPKLHFCFGTHIYVNCKFDPNFYLQFCVH